jgi:hypothetical protein
MEVRRIAGALGAEILGVDHYARRRQAQVKKGTDHVFEENVVRPWFVANLLR